MIDSVASEENENVNDCNEQETRIVCVSSMKKTMEREANPSARHHHRLFQQMTNSRISGITYLLFFSCASSLLSSEYVTRHFEEV